MNIPAELDEYCALWPRSICSWAEATEDDPLVHEYWLWRDDPHRLPRIRARPKVSHSGSSCKTTSSYPDRIQHKIFNASALRKCLGSTNPMGNNANAGTVCLLGDSSRHRSNVPDSPKSSGFGLYGLPLRARYKTTVAELFYLRHLRSCAANALGCRTTSCPVANANAFQGFAASKEAWGDTAEAANAFLSFGSWIYRWLDSNGATVAPNDRPDLSLLMPSETAPAELLRSCLLRRCAVSAQECVSVSSSCVIRTSD